MKSKNPYQLTYVYGRNKNNKYSYALNNPIRFTDPSGNDPYWVWENGQYVKKYENTAQRERIKKQREWNMNNAPDGKPTSETDFFKKMDRWMIRLENNISRLIESMFRKEEESKIITINGEKMVRVIDKATSLEQIIPLSNYNPEIQTALEIIHKEVEFKLLQLREKPHLGSTRNGENAQGGGGYHSNSTGFEGFNQDNVDFGGAVGGGLTTVFGAASHYSGFIKAAGKIGFVGNAVTGLTYGHAVLTHQAKPAHHLDAAVTGALIIGGLVSIVVPPIAPYVIGIGFGYGGGRLLGGEVFDNWFNSQFTPTPILSPNKINP